MKNTDSNNRIFNIHSSIVFQLGESLISDSVQALVELIKNSYDADASYANVKIETIKKNDFENSHYPDAYGYILIQDDGHGMNETSINQGWLTISNSLKRDQKKTHKTSPKGRTPLGDKGLGRLGSQRLGDNLEIFTKPENEAYEYHVAFSWKDFRDIDKLEKVQIYFKKSPSTRKKGTTLLISDIKDPSSFESGKPQDYLKKEFSMMISPYTGIKEFTVLITINGNSMDIADLSAKILNGSQLRYLAEFDGITLRLSGQARLSYIRPQTEEDLSLFKKLVEKDKGEKFYKYLSDKKEAKTFHLQKSKKEGWFVEYQQEFELAELDKLEFFEVEKGKKKMANPGKFTGQIDYFKLNDKSAEWQEIFSDKSEFKKIVKSLSGIRVYRDGFRIRVDKDWLGLAKQSTSGTSYYGLRVENTIGYIALSARDNNELEETTDREGFKKSAYYNNFFILLERFVKFTGDAQTFLRREWNRYRDNHNEEKAQVTEGTTIAQLSETIKTTLSHVDEYRTSFSKLKVLILEKAPAVEEEANIHIASIDGYLSEISRLKDIQIVLENKIELMREQMDQLYETASLGLTAEALSHEIHTIADRLAKHTSDIQSYSNAQSKKDPKVFSFIEHVKSSIAALRKQMAHLAPSLKYVREQREIIDVFPTCREIVYYHSESLKKSHVEVQVISKMAENFFIHMNRGKLTQILDNLFLNSGYWLREDIRLDNISKGRIIIEIDKPFIRFSDNGRGIDPAVEETLFEPFVSTKLQGRGLGLFIVRQLLDSEGCNISLLEKRNPRDRRFIFEIDFSGGLYAK